jgi:hypothetical protein
LPKTSRLELKNQNLGNFEGGKIKPGWLDGKTGHLTGFQSSIFEI